MSNGSLKHYGMPRRSGRYPWGSGENPYQRYKDFRARVLELKQKGYSEVDIAKLEGISTTQLRARMSIAKAEERELKRSQVLKLKDKGYSNMEIARRMGLNESSVRSLLNDVLAERASIVKTTSEMLKENTDKYRFIDIGAGIENHVGVSRTKLNAAITELEEKGYKVYNLKIPQLGVPGQYTTIKVLGAPDSTFSEVRNNLASIKTLTAYSEDYGRTFKSALGLEPIKSIKSDRVMVRYAEEGGKDKDGVIELRRGVEDLDLGNAQYAQVRIAVDDKYYLKGMAIYSDNMPDGVDIIFNTNKSKKDHPNKVDVMKKMKTVKNEKGETIIDPDNPFGATIKRQHGALNIVNEEGDWNKWARTISSQVLSKQTVQLAKQQLDLAYKIKAEEYEEIMSLTNPIVKKQLLLSFADDCDASAVHLKAAALPRQANKVLLPIPELKENEVYAPSFKNGESVVLIRHPHGGRFEIPRLTVNNKSKAAEAVMKNAIDAIGINPKVAQTLSGADFDGDTVIVIPDNRGYIKDASSIKDSSALKSLKNFDPIEMYKIPEGSNIKPITPRQKQIEMGKVSNLITDMTIQGAPLDEIVRAVKHSMVVIDAEKHNLDFRQSYIDQGIASLNEKYQRKKTGGASTLISKASAEVRVNERKPRPMSQGGPIDPVTGKKVYVETGRTYVDKKGRVKKATVKSTFMAETDDAYTLSSGTQMEAVYAEYANSLKRLANESRRQALQIVPTPYNPSARRVYEKEVVSLDSKLRLAVMNKPLERKAQILANSIVKRKMQDNPELDKDDLKKIKNQALAEARARTGAKKNLVYITDKEWEAIQAGAVSPSKLDQILQNADLDRVKQLATPRSKTMMTPAKISRAKAMFASGYTQAEVADALGVSIGVLLESLQ